MFQIKVLEKIKTHILYAVTFYENRAVFEVMSKNMVEPERTHKIWRLRVACWIIKLTRAQAHARACAPTHTQTHARTRMPLPTRALERARTLTQKYVILYAFHGNSGFVDAPKCCLFFFFCLLLRASLCKIPREFVRCALRL